jgi:aspartyl-tRNA(Asn)/glutamyl-tRNA(Gln) amidotransferase subunit A
MKSIRELAGELATGGTTSVELTQQALSRIEAHREAGGAAYVSVDAQAALAAAHASDVARAAGYVPSLLAGLPIAVKDLFDVQGQVTSAGSLALADSAPAARDAVAVARLRAAGAVLLGRSNMSEFAFSGLGLNPHYGTPRCPADTARVSGGSSSGGAVAVALEMAVAALGTDTGGSIRIPSAFCGLTGFKPTARRVSLSGAVPLSRTLDSAGPLARTVDCCAIVDAILSGDELDTEPLALAGLRLGVTADVVGTELEPEVERDFEQALQKLQQAGAHIERFAFPELLELGTINAAGGLVAAEAWHWHRALLAGRAAQYDPRVAARIERGARQSAADYLDVVDARQRMIAAAQRRLRGLDAWLMPTVATLPPLLAPLQGDDATFFSTNARVLRNPSVINFLDGCAVTMPVNPAGQLPVGLAVCGLAMDDARILRIARSLETRLHPR